MSENTGRKPTHKACLINEYKDNQGTEKVNFIEICPIWESEKGNLMINIPKGMLLHGKLIVMPIKEKEWQAPLQEGEDVDVPF